MSVLLNVLYDQKDEILAEIEDLNEKLAVLDECIEEAQRLTPRVVSTSNIPWRPGDSGEPEGA